MRGLEFVHARDFWLMNLTPENIFIEGDCTKIGWFGGRVRNNHGEYNPPEFWLKEK
jgi:hypothetical protein